MTESSEKKVKRFWPHYLVKLGVVMIIVTIFMGWMANLYPVPDDAPEVVPFPDDGENVPGPEWLFLLFWIPFWYFKGRMKKYLFLTTVVPIVAFVFLVFLPYFHKLPLRKIPGLKGLLEKAAGMRSGLMKSFIYGLPAIIVFAGLSLGMYQSGHQAKILGCDSCHNPAMGHRMAIPPVDVFGYYTVERAMQIGVGKYRAGKSVSMAGGDMYTGGVSGGEEGGYKDSNWQMRHMYEPTFTW